MKTVWEHLEEMAKNSQNLIRARDNEKAPFGASWADFLYCNKL